MSDAEHDPYAVSSDSDDDERSHRPPPKIAIEGRAHADLTEIKQALAAETRGSTRDQQTKGEIEALRKSQGSALAKKKDFEAGKSSLVGDAEAASIEDRLKEMVAGREAMSSVKQRFETASEGREFASEQREEVGQLKRSEAERKRVLAQFMEEEAKEPPRNCRICDKIVYNVERVCAAKNTYHNTCFLCCKCSKKLTPTTFNSHDGRLFCRAHYREALHPEAADAVLDIDDDEAIDDEDEDDEFALVSKPKQLAADVVRAAATPSIGDELAQLRSLKQTKAELEQSAAAADGSASTRLDAAAEIATGRVAESRNRIAAAATDERVDGGDSNSRNDELEELRRGPRVADRFKEGAQTVDEPIVRSFDPSVDIDTAAAAEARRSFIEGSAFVGGPVERSAADLDDIKKGSAHSAKERFEKGMADEAETQKRPVELDVQLAHIKEALNKLEGDESTMSPEQRGEKKRKEIEEEFLRYKIARKLQDKRAQQTNVQVAADDRDAENGSKLDVEIKMAGKARERFMAIDAQNLGVPTPASIKNETRPSKWSNSSKEGSAEVVNRRVADDESDDEDEDAFDVKHLMNKFKNLQDSTHSKMEKNLDELEALRIEARNLRQQFEAGQSKADDDQSEERKKQLQDELRLLTEERERAQRQLEAERVAAAAVEPVDEKEIVQVAVEHAHKMTEKFEKLERKQARAAERSKLPSRS